VCSVRLDCGRTALAAADAGQVLYGVLCGVEFTDVTPCRQDSDIERLRAVVAELEQS
jgi:hypothetical protein